MGLSVLIIDDEPLICMGLLELIDWKRYGFDLTDTEYSYVGGLKAAISHPYTLIITDIRLHDMSGLDLIKLVKEYKMCDNFIVISAYAEFEYAQKAIQYGVKQFLLKPLNRDDVIKCIESFTCTLPGHRPDSEHGAPNVARTAVEDSGSTPGDQRLTDIDSILDYIAKHYDDKRMSLVWFADKMYMNSSYLGQRFKKHTGVKFTDYLNQFRIVKACEMLLKGNYLTYEVCERVGYGSIAYFHRMFKRFTGYGTEEYKKRLYRGLSEIPGLPQKTADQRSSKMSDTDK